MNLTEPIPEPEVPEDPDQLLTSEQATRAFALSIAKPFLTHTGLASKTPPTVDDLITLANWIVQGSDDSPLYPYADADGTVHLGPNTSMSPDGYLQNGGVLYQPSADDNREEGEDA